jgi:formylglycine-generating enzyme required for sulfatase activity
MCCRCFVRAGSGPAMPKIFISYRREDSAYPAAVIRSRLVSDFGQSEIFFDVDSIPPGHDFRVHIGHKVGACDYVIVVIGKAWLTACDEAGGRRLDNPADFVRLEIEAALKRNIPVIPVLVDNAPMPKADQLPEHLSDLVYRHAHFVRPEPDLNHDLERLARRISEQEAERRLQEERRRQETQKAEEERLEREAAARAENERLEEEARAAQARIEEERERQEAKQRENERQEREAAILAEKKRLEQKAQERVRLEQERPAAEKRAEEERQREAERFEQECREKDATERAKKERLEEEARARIQEEQDRREAGQREKARSEHEAAARAEKVRLEREAGPALFAPVAEGERLQRQAGWLRRPLVLGTVAIVAAIAVLLVFSLFKKPNGPGIDGRSGNVRQLEGAFVVQTKSDNGLGTKLVWIPPGDFTMGSPKNEEDRLEKEQNDNEGQVQVTLTKGFWLGQHETTQAEWQRVMQTTPWTPWSGNGNVKAGDDYPASYVSWDDAMKFCEKLTETERSAGRLPAGWKYTLPTEAQWEYACRAGTTTRFSFGDDQSDLNHYGWWGGTFGGGNAKNEQYAHEVAQKKANPWGLYDMHGNVEEWCSDYFAEKRAGGTDPQGPSEGLIRVYRGGSWEYTARYCRSAYRSGGKPDYRNDNLGFRVAIVPSGK